MTTTTREAANRPMSAPNVTLVLMAVLWVILLFVVIPSLGCEVLVLVDGCLSLVVTSLTSPSILVVVDFAIVNVDDGGVGVGGC